MLPRNSYLSENIVQNFYNFEIESLKRTKYQEMKMELFYIKFDVIL